MSDCPTTKVNISLFSPNRFVNLSQPQVCKEYSFSNFLSSGKELLYVTLWSDGQNKILKGSNPYSNLPMPLIFYCPCGWCVSQIFWGWVASARQFAGWACLPYLFVPSHRFRPRKDKIWSCLKFIMLAISGMSLTSSWDSIKSVLWEGLMRQHRRSPSCTSGLLFYGLQWLVMLAMAPRVPHVNCLDQNYVLTK